jgi:hypothetical protein
MLRDPFAAPELADGGVVELTPWGVVDVLEARAADFELGFFESAFEAFVLPTIPLNVDEEPEPFVEAEPREIGVFLLFDPGLRQAV